MDQDDMNHLSSGSSADFYLLSMGQLQKINFFLIKYCWHSFRVSRMTGLQNEKKFSVTEMSQ